MIEDFRENSFLGVPMVQWYCDLFLWEEFLCKNTIKTLIELGTGYGGFSLFLFLQSIERKFSFYTFDVLMSEVVTHPVSMMLGLDKRCFVGDIFQERHQFLVDMLQTAEHPILLYCDNGHKPSEVGAFAPLLRFGDFVAVHDWGTEFTKANIPLEILEEYFTEEYDSQGAITRWMRRI